jgi:hypothetical protein
MRTRRQLAVLLILLAVAPGCATTGARDLPGWAEARGADLMDVIGLRVALGPGLGAYLRLTEVAQLGYLSIGEAELYLPSPQGASLRAFPAVVFGLRGRYGGLWFESSTEFMLPGFSTRDYTVVNVRERPIQRESIAGYVTPNGEYDDWRYELGLGVHLIVVGIQFEVRPLQGIDFIAGLLGYDPAGDDVTGSTEMPENSAQGGSSVEISGN